MAWAAALVGLAVTVAAVVLAFRHYATAVTVTVDGYGERVYTTRSDVAGLLADLGLQLRAEDRVWPQPAAAVEPGLQIIVKRARPALLTADGAVQTVYSQASTAGELLAGAGIDLNPQDEIWLGGLERVTPDTALPAAAAVEGAPKFPLTRAWAGHQPPPVRLTVRRAVPITVDDGGAPYTLFTTAPTVGEALLREQMSLYLGDQVQPSLGSTVSAGLHVIIQRSKPVLVTADRRSLRTRTRSAHVGDALAELGIMIAGSDRVTPAMDQPVSDGLSIKVVRVVDTVAVEREAIPFESVIVPSETLEIDHQELQQQGQAGEFRRRYHIVNEDGVETARQLVDAWVATQPITQVTAYGQQIISRPIEGTGLTYWRKIRMRVTAYSKSTAGVSPSSPYFGRTRLGLAMRKGIVAVDPTVILLGSQVYVPGYGVGLAGDTGGGIKGAMIDLGYDDDNLQSWYGYTDVYQLDPPPPRSQIRWILPGWQTK